MAQRANAGRQVCILAPGGGRKRSVKRVKSCRRRRRHLGSRHGRRPVNSPRCRGLMTFVKSAEIRDALV